MKKKDEAEPSILVLLSAYNGEKYIEEQVNSILSQKNVKVHILIRDDGSKDRTPEIIQNLSQKFDNIDYYSGNNIGFISSFNDLIMRPEVNQYEWVAFSDQDDVWKDTKLFKAICAVNTETDIPQLYCSNLTLVDSQLKEIGVMRNYMPNFDKYSALVQSCATGCTEVFNHELIEIYRHGVGAKMELHDYWMFLCAIYFGKVMYDPNSYIYYRQHGNNQVGASKRTLIKALRNLKQSNRRIDMLSDFVRIYEDKLNINDKNIINPILNYKRSLKNRIQLIFNPKYRGYSRKVSAGFKFRALIGRIY